MRLSIPSDKRKHTRQEKKYNVIQHGAFIKVVVPDGLIEVHCSAYHGDSPLTLLNIPSGAKFIYKDVELTIYH